MPAPNVASPQGCRRTSLQLIQGSYIRVCALYGGRVQRERNGARPLLETVAEGTTELVSRRG